MRRLSTFPPKISRRIYDSASDPSPKCKTIRDDTDFCCLKPSWKNFTLSELEKATDNFNPESLIGKCGYAEVYRGCLEDGQLVAVKRLTRGTSEERIGDFLSELGIFVHIDHPNAARLIGFGVEGEMHLVLPLSAHGSLASLLHGSKENLDWSIRFKIALGTAVGLQYLHESCQRRIIHRDIKASNILLTVDFEPQISDVGLAKWLPDQLTYHIVSKFEGTFGYLAPEYFMHGIVIEKTDVFAFGAKPLIDQNSIREFADPSLAEDYDVDQMNGAVTTASACI